jgi:UDP-glucose 4-epimerase
MELSGRKILVTGGAGFIGSHTVDALIKKGARVVVVDNLLTGREENINPRAKFYKTTVASSVIDKIFQKEKPEIVYHFAWFVLVPKSVENPLLDKDSILGVLRILQNSKKYGVKKIIFPSSGFIYGNTTRLPTPEQQPPQPVSPYAILKFTAEQYLKFFKKAFNLPYVILRYSAVYGPRQVTGAMSAYIRDLRANRPSEFYGRKTRDYVYISDVVRANLLALNISAEQPEPVFNIGTGLETSLPDLYARIAEKLGKGRKDVHFPDRCGEQTRYALDIRKAKRGLGWQPKISLNKGLEKTIAYWKEKWAKKGT